MAGVRQKNGIQLTRRRDVELARSRRAVAMGLPAPPTTARSAPATEAGRAAADYRMAWRPKHLARLARSGRPTFTLLATSSLTPDQSDQLLSLAKELDRLPEVDADAKLVAEILRLQSLAEKHTQLGQAADTARKAHSDTVKRHKSELEAAWKKMRITENRCQQAGDAARKLDELRFRNPWFFTPDGKPRLRTAVALILLRRPAEVFSHLLRGPADF